MSAGHTPGPWVFAPNLVESGTVISWTVGPRVNVAGFEPQQAQHIVAIAKDTEANARLIAAAPDMLSALQRVQHNYGLMLAGKPVRDVEETMAEVNAALSRTTGQATLTNRGVG